MAQYASTGSAGTFALSSSMSSDPANNPAPGRFLMLDGLRGVAAISVVIGHLFANVADEMRPWLPGFILNNVYYGYLGVSVFFVISGFVIAMSIGANRVTPRYIGNFALRRAVRLDPPYWGAILILLALEWVKSRLFPSMPVHFPSPEQLFAHLFYLQDLLGYGGLSPVYWTLCLEFQFYLVYVISLGLIQQLSARTGSTTNTLALWFFTGLGIVSLCMKSGVLPTPLPGLFIVHWHMFYLGVFVYWVINGNTTLKQFLFYAVINLAFLTAYNSPATAAALVTSLFILYSHRAGKINRYLSSRFWQYLGMISYSLYLLHPDIGWRVISILKKIIGPDPGLPAAGMIFTAGLILSLVAADIFYRLVERPSNRLSKKLKKTGHPVEQASVSR